jgi:cytochrome c553
MKTTFTLAGLLIACTLSFSAVAGGNVAAGKALSDKYNCASCHGKDFNTPIDPGYPKLAGQHQDYLEQSLVGYQRGAKAPNGRSNAIMSAMAKPLSRKDINDLAAYMHSLPGSLVIQR